MDLGEIEIILDKWLFKKRDDYSFLLNYNENFTPFAKAFTERLKTIPWKFSKSEMVSGGVCFFGGVVTSLLNYGYVQELEGLFTFAVCYMMIDHFLDDSSNSDRDKDQCVREIYNFIVNDIDSDNKIIGAIKNRYLDLITRVPNCKQYFIKLFNSELKGLQIQRSKHYSRDDYLNVALEKGGYTSLCIASILGLNVNSESLHRSPLDNLDMNNDNYNLGSLIQTPCDDLLDLMDDERENIYTLIRYDIDHSNLDQHLFESIKKIDNLGNVYNFFKVILLLGIILGIHDNPNSVSSEMYQLLSRYDIFQGWSKTTLTQWFHDKWF